MRARSRGWIAAALVAALVAASCSGDPSVRVEQSMEAGDTQPAPGTSPASSTVPEPIGPPGTTQPPDPTGLPELDGKDPNTVDAVLDNGLRYLVRQNDNPGGKVELRLVIDAGSGLEDDDQVGGAHFLEHMLFNGTERFPKNELIDVLRSFGAAFGADVNASTSYDETVYTLNVPDDAEAVDTALDILEEWLTAATIAPDDVEAERGIILDEYRGRQLTSNGRLIDRRTSFFLDGTAYEGHLPIGGQQAIESITADALRRFYDDWYRPDNASVIVVGDIDVDRIVDGIESRFADVEPRSDSPERVVLEVNPSTDTRVDVFDDPDLAEGFVHVVLPRAVEAVSLEADSQNSILERLAFDIVATRLDNDALRGEAPFERASAGGSSFVRQLSAPQIGVDVDGASVASAVEAVLDEFERVARFGVTPAELERAIGARRSAAQRNLDGRMSRQDASFADEYTRHVLEGEWYVTAQREFEFTNAVLDRATVETVAYTISDRYRSVGAHVFVAVPEREAVDVASPDAIAALVDGAPDRDLEPRPAEAEVGDSLMDRP
ncbi:MAG: M16 family metallopeptidase, partial [Ilumatobacter sp.]